MCVRDRAAFTCHTATQIASMRVARRFSLSHPHTLPLSLFCTAHSIGPQTSSTTTAKLWCARGLLKIPPKRTVSESGRAKTDLPADLRSKVEIFPSFGSFFECNLVFFNYSVRPTSISNSGERDPSRPSHARAETSNLHRFLTELTHTGDRGTTVSLPRAEIRAKKDARRELKIVR